VTVLLGTNRLSPNRLTDEYWNGEVKNGGKDTRMLQPRNQGIQLWHDRIKPPTQFGQLLY
jgi:hypothetical protein